MVVREEMRMYEVRSEEFSLEDTCRNLNTDSNRHSSTHPRSPLSSQGCLLRLRPR